MSQQPALSDTPAPPEAPADARPARSSDRLSASSSARRRLAAPAPPVPPPGVRRWARSMTRLTVGTYFRVEHRGHHHIPAAGPAIVISNHPTYLDPFFVGWPTRRWITWMAWDESFEWPLLGRLVRAMGALPVNLERAQPSTVRSALEVLARGRLLGIFLEGGRSQGFDLDPPRPGAARIARLAGAPVVPVTIAGARRLWPRDGLPRPGRVVVRYHPPLHPAEIAPGAPTRAQEELLTTRVIDAIRSHLRPDGRPLGPR